MVASAGADGSGSGVAVGKLTAAVSAIMLRAQPAAQVGVQRTAFDGSGEFGETQVS